jgi:hypothetical protein
MLLNEYRNPFQTTEVNLEIAIGAINFRDKTIDNLRQQIESLRNLVERFVDDPEDIDDAQYAHLKETK